MNSAIQIGQRYIGQQHPPFVIAEMSGNHNQSLERALEIVEAAAVSGAHAIKLQTYTADTITLDVRGGDFDITDPNSLWVGKNLHDLYQQAHTPWEWHAPIMQRARELGLICFSSPFDELAVDFLEGLDVPAYKIASFENNHLPLIAKAASKGKPLIISTGMASLGELEQAVSTARSAGCTELVLLKCTSTYPATPANTNIRTIPHLRELFGCEVGLSDHTTGLGVAVAAIALGATVIEKHFTLSRTEGGVDSDFSLEPAELSALVQESKRAWQALGKVRYGPTEAEQKSLVFRRSVYASADIEAGELFTSTNIRIVRPGHGAPPHLFEQLLGRQARQAYSCGTPLSLDQLL
ncbi:pseudaminic acid synthase [Cyanobium sp. Maggiore-St4-Cus]|uniref:pseudaminic acid synthase n=1 Tax=Cyanobium sp. Maggiore-St4-Cus TaxID=2823717 RepID=UPI0020CE15D3|nr:pseudaminic acid synthase [Cyanobium sp. Maggiore-St4-Cus]MCP9787675.1 pseudaminic acid synthase [Cyanobium sp. Maggiore-St4-Cus]